MSIVHHPCLSYEDGDWPLRAPEPKLGSEHPYSVWHTMHPDITIEEHRHYFAAASLMNNMKKTFLKRWAGEKDPLQVQLSEFIVGLVKSAQRSQPLKPILSCYRPAHIFAKCVLGYLSLFNN